MKTRLKCVILSLICFSCGGTDSGNPRAVGLVMQAIVRSAPGAMTLPSGIEVSSAKVVVDRVRYRPFENCNSGIDENVSALSSPKLVDLLNPETLVAFNASSQKVCRLEVRISKEHTFSELSGLSMRITGASATPVPFVVELEIDNEWSVRDQVSGIILQSQTSYIMGFNLNEWFVGVDLSSAELELDGSILISKDKNDELLDEIVENIKESASLHKDDDDDGEYDDDDDEIADDD